MPTTPNGTDWVSRTIYPVGSPGATYESAHGAQDAARWHEPTVPGVTVGEIVMIYCHGAGGSSNEFLTLSGWTDLRNACMDAGWVVCEADAGHDDLANDNNWGNDFGRTEYECIYLEMLDRFPVAHVVILGRSMGGLCAAWLACHSTVVDDVLAVTFSSAVVSLEGAHDWDANDHAAKILRAYDAETYAEVPAGHDPALWPSSDWAGLHTRWWWTTEDVTVPPSIHGEVVQPIAEAGALDAEVETAPGPHASLAGYHLADGLVDWVTVLLGGDPPDPDPPDSAVSDAHGLPVVLVDANGVTVTP